MFYIWEGRTPRFLSVKSLSNSRVYLHDKAEVGKTFQEDGRGGVVRSPQGAAGGVEVRLLGGRGS